MSDALRVALIGYGFVGRVFHAPLIRATPGYVLHSVVSRDAGKVHADLPDIRVCADAQDAFADAAVDVVVIAAPNDVHAPLARAALAHGKHVVVDKPFTLTTAEARDVLRAAEDAQRIVSVFQNRRWDADFLTVRRLLDEGVLGRVAEFHSHFDRFRPQVQDRWRERAGAGAGLWYDLGPHLLDQAVELFGMPQSISADIAMLRDGAQAPDYFDACLRYPRHRVILHAGALVAANGLRFAVHGTQGSYVKHGLDVQEDQLRAGMQPGEDVWGLDTRDGTLTMQGDEEQVTPVHTEPGDYRRYYTALRDAIRHGAPAPVTPTQAIDIMRLIEAGTASAVEARAVAV